MSEIKVNKLSPRTNCGTVQLGDSGDTITIPAGVTITNNGTAAGFGATGAASWDTTVKTSGFTAVSGVGYFVNTTGGAISVNLPAGVAGAVVAIKDYANTFDTNNVTLVQNGSDKIGGSTDNSILSREGIAVTLVFIDATQGWLVTDSGLQSEAPGPQYVTATGGTETISGDFKIHTFTGPGTFCVSCAGNAGGSSTVDYLVVAGGGSGGNANLGSNGKAGGAGAGGYRESSGAASGCYTTSPLGACVAALPVSATAFPITVGGGGAAVSSDGGGNNGSNSIFSSITSTGGGGGGRDGAPNEVGNPGGSGGGSGLNCSSDKGAGNTPPVSPPQGQPGGASAGTGPCTVSGGGGGAIQAGQQGTAGSGPAGPGGNGATSSINATPTARAGGGGGGANNGQPGGGAGGSGGGGAGGAYPLGPGTNGTTNTGGGGGASASGPGCATSGAGGSGIVIIRYKFQN
jgi:hypothetical protein